MTAESEDSSLMFDVFGAKKKKNLKNNGDFLAVGYISTFVGIPTTVVVPTSTCGNSHKSRTFLHRLVGSIFNVRKHVVKSVSR